MMKNRPSLPFLSNIASLRSKLLFSFLVIAGFAILVSGYFFYNRTQQTQNFLQSELQRNVRQQSSQQLKSTINTEAQVFDQFFTNSTSILTRLSSYQTAISSQQAVLGDGEYWNAQEKLITFPDGQVGNAATDTASIFIPNTIAVTDAMLAEMNLNIYLDFAVPSILKNTPDIASIYFISEQGYTIYYPNIELAKIAPPNFDPRTQPYYRSAQPDQNPEKKPVWGEPYQDTAGAGLIVTGSMPVYDESGKFRGVLGIDVQLEKITQAVEKIRAGKTGFAFLIDRYAHPIAMPQIGYDLFDLVREAIPPGEPLRQTMFGQVSGDFSNLLLEMTIGKTGVSTISIKGTPYYMAYTSLPTTGYSLAIIVPTVELDEPFLAAQNRLVTKTQTTLQFSMVVALGIFFVAAVISLILGQSIAGPLVRLTETARQIQTGNFQVRAEVETNDEIGTLASVFNNMTEQIQRSFVELEHRVAERTKALQISLEVSRQLSVVTSPRQLATNVVEQLQSAFGYYHAHIYFFDEKEENLVMAGGTGEAGAVMLAAGHSIPRGRGLVGRAAETKAPVLVSDVTQAIGWLPNPLLPQTQSEAAVPIMSGEKVLGVLDVQQNRVNGLTEDDVILLQSIASQVAISLQNARAYEQSATQAEMEAAVNYISQRIQRAGTVEETLQTAIRELSQVLGAKRAGIKIGAPQTERQN
ncbi:MAG: hypothetical protein DDG60_15230 [Anaerolineae bacterium]|nr:MAG: hypothetical protein DDG60_15230 [Anaerolineae bacterium]